MEARTVSVLLNMGYLVDFDIKKFYSGKIEDNGGWTSMIFRNIINYKM